MTLIYSLRGNVFSFCCLCCLFVCAVCLLLLLFHLYFWKATMNHSNLEIHKVDLSVLLCSLPLRAGLLVLFCLLFCPTLLLVDVQKSKKKPIGFTLFSGIARTSLKHPAVAFIHSLRGNVCYVCCLICLCLFVVPPSSRICCACPRRRE